VTTTQQHALRKYTPADLSNTQNESSVPLDDNNDKNVVDVDDNAHSNAPNNSYKQSTVTAEVCSRCSVGGDAARAARSRRPCLCAGAAQGRCCAIKISRHKDDAAASRRRRCCSCWSGAAAAINHRRQCCSTLARLQQDFVAVHKLKLVLIPIVTNLSV
jgi:hypothetical protein